MQHSVTAIINSVTYEGSNEPKCSYESFYDHNSTLSISVGDDYSSSTFCEIELNDKGFNYFIFLYVGLGVVCALAIFGLIFYLIRRKQNKYNTLKNMDIVS